MRIMKNRTKPGIPYYLVLIWNCTKPGTALIKTILTGDLLYYIILDAAARMTVIFKSEILKAK